MINEIYFDNAATTKPDQEVVAELNDQIANYYNPSALYKPAVQVSQRINDVRKTLLEAIRAEFGTVIFTSGGTESINSAILSIDTKGKTIISTEYEHDATHRTLDYQQQNGIEVIKIKPQNGVVSVDDICNFISERTALVSIMHVNNEVGNIIPIQELGLKIKRLNPRTLFHVDAVQSFTKMDIDVEASAIDLLSLSSHKIHGLKGIGALYIRRPERFKPYVRGGGQENGLRSGTENVLGIVALGVATTIGINQLKNNMDILSNLKQYFIENLSVIGDTSINSPIDGAPHILNVSFLGVPSEILLHTLEANNIFVSSGSACSSKKRGSHVLKSLGFSDEIRNSAIRFSFSKNNTLDEVDRTLSIIEKEVKEIRKLTKYRGKNV